MPPPNGGPQYPLSEAGRAQCRAYRSTVLLRNPDGPAGLALLLLRLSSALIAYPVVMFVLSARLGWAAAAGAAALLVAALLAGAGTRPAALLLIAMLAARIALGGSESLFLLLSAGASLGALVLLGPGAYSLDAQRFGRRVIRVDVRTPDRGASG